MVTLEIIKIEIPNELSGIRLDKALGTFTQIGSRSQATRLIDLGRVKLNDKIVKPSLVTEAGQVFHVELLPNTMRELLPYDIRLDIVFEDDDLIVVNKPSGLVVHPAFGHDQDTLVNALLNHTKNLSSGFAEGRPGIVHRLDKDTSGLIVVAKNDRTHRALATQFKKKLVHRIYWAVCTGILKEKQGTIKSYLKRHPVDRKRFSSSPGDGKEAITHYNVQSEGRFKTSLLHLRLETGRTHQIRVHLSESGHFILADPIYGKSKTFGSGFIAPPHLMLHAAEIGFIHPRTSKKILLKAPWPDELIPTLKSLELI
jgi:23S rRNA pseudouridine1911/1915/1917 synthase